MKILISEFLAAKNPLYGFYKQAVKLPAARDVNCLFDASKNLKVCTCCITAVG